MANAEIVIVAEDFGDLLGRPDQRGGVAVGPGEFCHFGPETLVDTRTLLGQRQQPARAGRRMTVSRPAIAGLVLQRGRARQNLLRLCPGPFLGVGKDGPDRQTESRSRPTVFRSRDANPRRHIAHLRIGFAPQRKCVGMLARDFNRGIGAAADEGVDASGLIGLDLGKALFDLVIFAVVVERFFTRPFGADDIEELGGAGVTLVLVVERVAVLAQLGGVAPGDDVQRHAAARKLVDGCELARKQRRRGKARPLRDHDLERLGDTKHVLADLQRVRDRRMERQQCPVETGKFMRLCHRLDIGHVEDRTGPHDGFGRIVVGDESDEFH